MKTIIQGTFDVQITSHDWGCGTARMFLHLDSPLDSLSKEDITVTEHKMATNFAVIPDFPIEEVRLPRIILDAFLIDEEGNRTESASREAVIELDVSPAEGSPLLFSMHTQFNTWSKPYELLVSLKEGHTLTSEGTEVNVLDIDPVYKRKTTEADPFVSHTFDAADGVHYEYVSWQPEGGSDRLVIWLHGLGEGGVKDTDPYVTCIANKVVSLISDEFQNTIGRANVLVPQCPTYWMDNEGTGQSLAGGRIKADNTSYYMNSLVELIKTYQQEHHIKKTVICGCSNGGFMTLLLGMDHPELADGIVPICEAVPDVSISEEQISNVTDMPMYFVYSEDDNVVDPTRHEIPTLARLRKAGAPILHVSTTEHVIDTSGKYKNEKGDPHMYSGHWSWIYFFNNECDAEGYKAWDFIRDCLK